jgi:hypothetical protein
MLAVTSLIEIIRMIYPDDYNKEESEYCPNYLLAFSKQVDTTSQLTTPMKALM